ncbi:MAG: GGDEF domain-containing protein [Negativicutes bacterium]|nr:GGDEF domain-containing protein [Negativicutes bacterium]
MLCLFFFAGRLIQRLYKKANTDCLTGLRSRTEFGRIVEKRTTCSRGSSSLLMIDVDNFKAINDRHGHPAGDDVLKALAAIFHQAVRGNDSVFRWGGDEFVVILSEASVDDATVIAERIRIAVEKSGLYFVTVSIGVAAIEKGGVGEAVALADKAMYQAKALKNAIAIICNGQEGITLKTA